MVSSKRKAQSATTPNKKTQQPQKSQRRHADIVENGKQIWNQLRVKNLSKQEKKDLVQQLNGLIGTKAAEIALQHDGSRLVQSVLQFGEESDRQNIIDQLRQSSISDLCKSQYSHFVILKILKYCDCSFLKKDLRSHMAKLAVHSTGSRVVEALLMNDELASLRMELYGPHAVLLETPKQPTLNYVLEKLPDKKDVVLDFCRNLVNKGLQKQLYGLSFFQELLCEFLEHVPKSEIRELCSTMADHAIHLTSTKAGTKVICEMIAYGTAKNRKHIMKSLKGYCQSALTHRDAYLCILRLCQLCDDTVSLQKNILNELNQNHAALKEVILNDFGSKLFTLLLLNDETYKKSFDPYELSVLHENPMIPEDGQQVPTSKKDASLRRMELLDYLKEALIAVCNDNTGELLTSIPGSTILREVCTELQARSTMESILNAAKNNPKLFEDKVAHRTFKLLNKTSEVFGDLFCETFSDQFMDICQSNRGAFVVSALRESSSRPIAKYLDKKKIQKLCKGKGPTAGYEALLKLV